MVQDCIFCKIGSGEIDSDTLYRDDDCFVVRDIDPKAPVHLLVIPVQHFTHLANLSEEFYPVLASLFAAARDTARREGVADSGYRLVINQGDDGGQVVTHLHMHLMGGRPLGEMG